MKSANKNKSIPFFRYFPAAIKFYGLKNDKIAAFVFIILLGINFCSNMFAIKATENLTTINSQLMAPNLTQSIELLIRIGTISLVTSMLMNIFSSFYLYAYLKDLRGIPYTFTECLKDIVKKLYKIIILSLIVFLAIFTGSILFAIPGIILYIMFIFANQFLVDQDRSVFNCLKGSMNLTNGYKWGIFSSVLMLNLIILIFPSFVEAGNGLLVFSFVSSFISTIFNIIYQRFVTIMYFDLEYLRKPKDIDINI